nr:MAG: ORF1 [TTV-like mini virus]
MPFYYRRPYYQNWRRRRYRRNRTGRYLRRRYGRRNWVRNKPFKKLKRITLKEWQPPCIRKCSIKGTACLAVINCERMGHNSTMYEESIVPMHWPGGGTFSVCQFSLNSLYNLHQKCRNWWTKSNVDLPLCRFLGTKVKFYQCEETDYIVRVNTNLPSPSNKLTYPSMQPYMMLMSSHKFIIPSKKNRKRRKPYYKKWFPPPQQLQTKWYFQVDFSNTPLIQFYTAATDLNNIFIKPEQQSQTITFMSLNTSLIQNRNMSTTTNQSWPFKKLGTLSQYMYFYDSETPATNTDEIDIGKLIPLTNIQNNTPGKSYYEINLHFDATTYKQYFAQWTTHAGNIFNPHHHEQPDNWYMSYKSPEAIMQVVQSKTITAPIKWKDLNNGKKDFTLTQLQEPIYLPFQYNPNKDTGQDTKCYLLSNASGDGWEAPSKNELILEGFPLWLILWGYTDFQVKLKEVTNINTNYIVVVKTHFTQRPTDMLIVPISDSFIKGNSPYEQQCLVPDLTRWYPMQQYQEECINKILSIGPGTPHFNDNVSENINILYDFKFKWGGCPPTMVNVDNPAHQAQYPIPRNEHETTSLQSPAQALESVMYSFDERHGSITKTALERITKDWRTQSFVPSITEPAFKQQLQQAFSELETAEKEELQKETQVLQQLQQLKQQQQSLRQRIILLMQNQSQ